MKCPLQNPKTPIITQSTTGFPEKIPMSKAAVLNAAPKVKNFMGARLIS
jgi:hypothetical protein